MEDFGGPQYRPAAMDTRATAHRIRTHSSSGSRWLRAGGRDDSGGAGREEADGGTGRPAASTAAAGAGAMPAPAAVVVPVLVSGTEDLVAGACAVQVQAEGGVDLGL